MRPLRCSREDFIAPYRCDSRSFARNRTEALIEVLRRS